MNKREIILDFTSLLDVIMIILFFFILFSHIETTATKQKIQQEQETINALSIEAEKLLNDANKKMLEAEEKNKLASEKLDEAEAAGERQGHNVNGIIEFSQSTNIKTVLKIGEEKGVWFIDIYQGNDLLSEIAGSDEITICKDFSLILEQINYTEDDTLLCEFIYNSETPGTKSAYYTVIEMFNQLKKYYPHFFYSETDMYMLNYEFKEE